MTRHMTQAEASKLAYDLSVQNGLRGWRVKFDRALKRAGQCHYATKHLSFSVKLLAVRTYEGSLDTIRHEVAHAICGPNSGHGINWRRKFVQLGGSGKRCFDSETIIKELPFKYVGRCSVHGQVGGRNRAPKIGVVYGCSKCPKSISFENFSWYENGKRIASLSIPEGISLVI